MKKKAEKPLTFSTRREWRSWLKRHQAKESSVWVQLYKKHVGRGLRYTDAVEEALCFGWIDGQLRRIDEKRHILRFSPRRATSVWAPSNIARVKKLIKTKRMTEAGLMVFRSAKLPAQTAPSPTVPQSLTMPHDLRQALAKRPVALQHFLGYPPSHRRIAIWWVKSAKKPETRVRRIRNIVQNAARYAKPQY